MSNENYELNITATDRATAVVNKFAANLERTTKPVRDLEQAMKRLGTASGLTKVAPALRQLRNGANDAAAGIRSIVPPLAAITGVGTLAGIAALVNGFAKMTVHSQNSATVLGVSTNELLRWQGAARLAGASAESMQSSLEGIGSAFNAAATIDPAKGGILRAIGVQVHHTADGSVDVQRGMLDLSDVFQKHTNAQYRIQLADALGISHDLIPLLARGRKALEEFYAETSKLALTPEQQKAADDYNRSLVNLDFSATNLKNKLGAHLAPAVQTVTDAVTKLVDKYGDVVASQVAEYTKRFADWLTQTDWAKVANDVKQFVDSIGGAKTVLAAIALLTFAGPISGVLNLMFAMGRLGFLAGGVLVTLGKIAASAAFGTLGAPAAAAAAEGAAGAEAAAGGGAILLGANGLIARFFGSLLGRMSLGAGLMLHSDDLNPGEGDYLKQRQALGGREKYLADQLTGAGYSKEQAAGIIGSLLQENGTLNPQAVNPKSGAQGIAQWLGSRATGFEAFAGTDLGHSSFEQQVAYMLHELQTSEAAADRRIRRQMDPASAASAHALGYERPGADEANLAQRAAYAREVYANMFGGTPMASKSTDNIDGFPIVQADAPKPGDDIDGFPVVAAQNDNKPQTFHLHITGLPAGASVRAKSANPGTTVTATVGHTSLGHDTM